MKHDLVLVPGLGADAGLYAPQKAAFGNRVHAVNWLDPLTPDESLESYARRLADAIRARPGLRRPFWIGGISFGGMLAAEIAECCSTDLAGLMLIGGCTDRREVARPIRWVAGLGQHLPVGPAIALLNHVAPALISWSQALGAAEARLYEQVYARSSKHIFQWGAEAMRNWESSALPRAPVFRAHGRLDFVIPIDHRLLRPGIDLVVPDGLHLISLSHAQAVNRWIAKTIARGADGHGGV